MKKIPIFGTGVKSISTILNAQRRLNCFYEVIQNGEVEQIAVRGTPGLTLWVTLPGSPIRGWKEAGQYLYVVAGSVLYQVNQIGGYIALGNLSGGVSSGPVSMEINETQVMIVDGVSGYVVDYSLIDSGNPSQIGLLISDTSALTNICNQVGNA